MVSGEPAAKKQRTDEGSPRSFPKSKIKVLLLEGVSQKGIQMLRDDGFQVEALKTALTEEELIQKVKGVHILGIRSKTQVTRKVLEASNRLLAISCFCIGTDQVDLNYAQELGIPVFNAPFANTRSVAELIIGNIVGLSRRIGECTMQMHRGAWFKQAVGCYEIRGKTLGVVGYGHIGAQVSVLAESMGMHVIYYDTIPKLSMGNATQVATLDDLLSQSDFVSLHVPKLPSTKNMIGKEQFAKMKKGSFFLNASRGNVVVIPDLAAALKSGHIRGAYVDVFPVEPGKNGEGFFESELRGCENVLMTPHVGGSTEEAQAKIGEEVAAALLKCVNEGSTHGAVNFPEVDMKMDPSIETHRVLITHYNKPGVMSAINSCFYEVKANVCQQFLSTKGSIGYVVVDTDVRTSTSVKEKLEKFENVIKVRVLY